MWKFMFWNLPIHNIMLFYTFFNHLESLPGQDSWVGRHCQQRVTFLRIAQLISGSEHGPLKFGLNKIWNWVLISWKIIVLRKCGMILRQKRVDLCILSLWRVNYFQTLKRHQMPSPNALEISKYETCKVKMLITQEVSLGEQSKGWHINKVPQNIVRTMLQINETTSVPKFNNIFELMETSRFVNDCEPTLHVGVTGQFNVKTIFYIAEPNYASSVEANQWNGVSNKWNKSTIIIVGSGKTQVCWNCGRAHKLPDCTLPKNQEHISEGTKKMQKAMKKARKSGNGGGSHNQNGGGGKFRKPSAE
jgi:hypothetical protein